MGMINPEKLRTRPGPKPKFSRAELDGMAREFASGSRVVDIASDYGSSVNFVHRVIKAYREGWSDELRARDE